MAVRRIADDDGAAVHLCFGLPSGEDAWSRRLTDIDDGEPGMGATFEKIAKCHVEAIAILPEVHRIKIFQLRFFDRRQLAWFLFPELEDFDPTFLKGGVEDVWLS